MIHTSMGKAGDLAPPPGGLRGIERFVLWAIRIWTTESARPGPWSARLRKAFEAAGAEDGYFALDHLLSIASVSASRPLNVGHPGWQRLTRDEVRLLAALRHAESGNLDACRDALAALLCPAGARLGVLPAWGVARALAGAFSGTEAVAAPRHLH